MDISKSTGYGIAASDVEGNWDPEFKLKIKTAGQRIVLNQLTFIQKLKLMYWFNKEKKRASKLKLSGNKELCTTE